LRWNLFTKQVEVCGGPLAGKQDLDCVVTAAQNWISATYGVETAHADMGRKIALIAYERRFDPICEELRGLTWDGAARIDADGGWLVKYGGVAASNDTEHARYVASVGRKFLVGLVGRGIRPGIKLDTVLVAEGKQGMRKSSMFEALGGRWFADASMLLGDKDSRMLAAAALLVELPDMASLKRSEVNAVKAFLATRTDTFRLPYGKSMISSPRRAVFCSTTNDDEYLADATGNRRFWPVKVDRRVDLAALYRDRDQLLAEAVHLFDQHEQCPDKLECGCWWFLDESIPGAETSKREEIDPWTDLVLAWVKDPDWRKGIFGTPVSGGTPTITLANVLVHGIGKHASEIGKHDQMRVASILKSAGWEKGPRPHGEAPTWNKTRGAG
jgi:predicted P-loop ATPase